jgi:hypothetical protein
MSIELLRTVRQRIIIAATIASVVGTVASIGAQVEPAPPDPKLIDRIAAGDLHAIEAAGQSRDPAYSKYIEPLLRDARLQRSRDTIRLALARLGASRQLQEYWCEAIDETVDPPVNGLGFIGGWYSILALRAILNGVGDQNFRKAVKRERSSDLFYLAPKYLALQVLPDVVPHPPIQFSWDHGMIEELNAQIEIWRKWIAAHESELRKLPPTGEAVELTAEACRKGAPRNKRP